ncbi:hypothetical protein ACFQZS_00835 [Mucilaginibacter calamicampi]|uniref:Uncharacterized protein n=1 Tax=Mucilaginibacter calamicampi TaxID=1302352 RepID=A0ABW2YRR9_9SPHI
MQKIRKVLLLFSCLVFANLTAFAGDPIPCSGDPDDPGYDPNGCANVPLDNWLIILVIGGLILATWYLHNKQKKEAFL